MLFISKALRNLVLVIHHGLEKPSETILLVYVTGQGVVVFQKCWNLDVSLQWLIFVGERMCSFSVRH